MSKLIVVEIRNEKTVRMPEHEVLLSFNDDVDAEHFEYWWNDIGLSEFSEWRYGMEGKDE